MNTMQPNMFIALLPSQFTLERITASRAIITLTIAKLNTMHCKISIAPLPSPIALPWIDHVVAE
jgi:hypothetical protein